MPAFQPAPHRRLKTRVRLAAASIVACYGAAPGWAQTTITAADLQKTGIGNFNAVQKTNGVDVFNLASRTVANAANFHVLAGETFKVYQNSASDAFMVRVVGQQGQGLQQSVIAGNVWSNGQFWLQNAAGTIIKSGAVIDTARFVAALNVTDADFLAGRLTFQNPTGSGKIVNQGTIRTPSGGSVYLVGTDVSNEGIISTPQGETILAAGATVNLVDTGTPGVKVEITGSSGKVTNLGSLLADAGRIGMAGVMVKNTGTINASSVVAEGGRIFLKATRSIELADSSAISADGTKGGSVIVKAEDEKGLSGTLVGRGTISAQGSGTKGSGGFVETSAAKVDLTGLTVKTRGGNWLLDPYDLSIGTDVSVSTLENALNAGNDVTITTDGSATPACTGVTCGSISGGTMGGDINVDSAITWTTSNTLTLNAYHDVNVNAAVTGTNGRLSATAGGAIVSNAQIKVLGLYLTAADLTINSLLSAYTVSISATDSVGLGTATGTMTVDGAELQNIKATELNVSGTSVSVNGVASADSKNLGNVVLESRTGGIAFGTTKSIFNSLTANSYSALYVNGDIETTAGNLLLKNAANGSQGTSDDDLHFGARGSQTLTSAGKIQLGTTDNVIKGASTVNLTAAGDIDFKITSDWSGTFTGDWNATAGGSIYADNGAIGGTSIRLTGSDLHLGSGLYATGNATLTARNSIYASNRISADGAFFATAAKDITIGGANGEMSVSLSAGSGGLALVAGDTLNIGGSVQSSGGIALAGNTINIGADVHDTATTTASGGILIVGRNLNASGTSAALRTDRGSIVGVMSGNVTLSDGAYFEAGTDITLGFAGADSTLSLTGSSDGLYKSYLLADSPHTINLAFTGRTEGGVMIDGVSTTTSVANGSGLFVIDHGTPAAPGAGLSLDYATNSSASATSISQVITSLNNQAELVPSQPPVTPPLATNDPNAGNTSTNANGGTTGGGENEFAAKKSPEEGETSKQAGDSSNGSSQGDKPATRRPVGRCTA